MVSTTQLFNEQLEKLELQIDRYQGLLALGVKTLLFPADIESAYREQSNAIFIRSSRLILSFGIFIYLAFGFTDVTLGQEQSDVLWLVRIIIAVFLLAGLALFFKQQLVHWVIKITAVGMIAIGLSIIFFITVLEEPYSYAYHLGLIPWQVFILISLRSYLRAIIACSLTVFICYILIAFNKTFMPFHPELDHFIYIMLPIFTIFWGLLISMGIYLGYQIERSARIDYVKNHLLSLEAQRLTLLSEELHLLSTTDSLTGLANRRHFESCFELEWDSATRNQTPISLIMIDIDFFKKYNDLYGHPAGDKCLRQVCGALKSQISRPGELVVRYGGEEFLVLLPRVKLADAVRIAENLCRKVSALDIAHASADEKIVTISLGVATLVPSQDDEGESLLRDADRALYQAKALGRNCVALPA